MFGAGKRYGPWRVWTEDGDLSLELSGEYVDGKRKP